MLHPGPLTVADGALDVALEPGASRAIDAVAAAAAPEQAFLRAAWFAAAGGAPLATLVARRAGTGEATAAIPLVPRRLGPLTVREVPGSYWPFRSFPIAADASEAEMVEMLASPQARAAFGRAWRLGPIPADDPAARHLTAAAPRAGWTVLSRRLATSYVLDLAEAAAGRWPSAKRRQKLRWRERRLAERGALDVTIFSGAAWTSAALDTLAAIEGRSWVARDASRDDAKFLPGAPARRIWEAALADPALSERLTAWLLHVGGDPAAFVFSLDCGGTRHVIANSYDARFAEGSPGLILLQRCFIQAAQAGMARIDWGAGDAGYKSEMGARPGAELVDLQLVRGTAMAALAALARPLWCRG